MTSSLLAGVLLSAAGDPPPDGPAAAADRADERRAMVEAVRRDIARNDDVLGRPFLSPAVEAALLTVPRHRFVPAELQPFAYENRALPIGLGQTISQPTIVAMMTELMRLAPGDTVLEVGTGSGYQAAVLSAVLPQGYVHTIEIVTELSAAARRRLADLGCDNVKVHTGDGYRGLPDLAPFAAIMVTAAAERVPPPLLAQLRPGGRLVMPVGADGDTQWLTVIEKQSDGSLVTRAALPVRFVPLTGEIERR
ncbi:MAG TPA: protein-L-isoaspartate(D-aspartate) O-methyltransferase [Candidatus Krumholzibacteria bacterium]|nr:protein-L-isoaspartate(D-aspartate) O-methyltransferase [Candidatus Krumholzibacteria bacterium]